MNVHQMVCHLNDSFRFAAGEKYASPASNLFTRTVVRWIALHTSLKWPAGAKTRPEVEQGNGGTPPADWARDCADLRESIQGFADRKTVAEHPFFGKLTRDEWQVWGYRHVDHHFRQFGV